MKPFVLLFFLLSIVSSHKHTYKCVFDQQNTDLRAQAANNVPEISVHSPGEHLNRRLLLAPSTTHFRALRIAIDTSYFSNSTIVPPANGTASTTFANLNFILQALAVTQHFYQTRLQAAPLTTITVPAYCVDFYTSNNGSTVNDTELLIFARYLTDPSKSYGATGKSCDWITWTPGQTIDYTLQVGRPTVGRIIFNTYSLVDGEPSLSNRLFQSVTATTIHQITHILGFDSTLYNTYLDIFTGKPYNYSVQILNQSSVNSRRPKTSILTTPNVKSWARNYYGCSTLKGMLLQNEDGTGLGSASHWERTAIYDQIMTGTAFGDSKGFFGLTFALLKDTGWYLADDTFAEISNYGYKKGCSFILDACYSSTPFTQFCDTASQPSTNSYCQSTFRGKAVCSSQAANMADNCGIYVPYYNCADPDSISVSNFQRYTNQIYATNSLCVGSTLGTLSMPSQLMSRCYPYTCATSSIVFNIGSYSITCLSSETGAIKTLSALMGSLVCPDFNDFCTNSRKVCTNWCSQNGFCTGGVCSCLPNKFGSDCSVTTCTVGNYYNPLTASCTSSCPPGTYPNVYSHTCVACQAPCYQCVNLPTNCLSCLSTGSLRFFYNGVCYSSCPNITYTSGGSCLPCDTNADCRTCSITSSNCTSCSNNKFWHNGTCVSSCPNKTDLVYNQCVNDCATYLLLNGTTCVFCTNGTYLRNGICQPNCTVNAPPYLYADEVYHACLACSNSCLTCDGPFPENCTSCDTSSPTPYLFLKMCWNTCPRGFYPNSVTWKCEMCPIQLNCQTCVFDPTASTPYCTSCKYNTFYFSNNSTCLSSCNTNQFKNTWNNSCDPCHSNCATCNGASSFSCLSCTGLNVLLTNSTGGFCLVSCPSVGYTKVGLTCQPCDATCNICNGTSSSNCTSCTSGYYYYGGFCRYICPAGTFPDTATLICQPCAGSCSYCFNNTASSCTSCVSGKYLFNFTCNSVCPNGMTPNQWNVCYQQLYQYGLFVLGVLLILIL